MSEVYQQLQDSLTEWEQLKKTARYVEDLNNRLKAEVADLFVMEKTLTKEQRDVEALEQDGLASMFHKFLGNREEKLEQGREDYLKAALRYNELYKSVNLIRYELEILAPKLETKEALQRKIEVQMKMREDELMTLDVTAGKELRDLHDQHEKLIQYDVEVNEALAAGTTALDLIRRTEYMLHSARQMGHHSWGTRYYSAGYIRHKAIDQARELAEQTRHALIRFGHELKDVFQDIVLETNLDTEQFKKFGGIFYDTLISDWIVRQNINRSMMQVQAIRQSVEDAMARLQFEKNKVNVKQEEIDKNRRRIILLAKD